MKTTRNIKNCPPQCTTIQSSLPEFTHKVDDQSKISYRKIVYKQNKITYRNKTNTISIGSKNNNFIKQNCVYII